MGTHSLLESANLKKVGNSAFMLPKLWVSVHNRHVVLLLLQVVLVVEDLYRMCVTRIVLLGVLLLKPVDDIHSLVIISHLLTVENDRLVESGGHGRHKYLRLYTYLRHIK